MRSCLINHKARNLLCLCSWKGKKSTEIPASLSWKILVSLLKCLWRNKSFDIAANFICKTFLFSFRNFSSLSRCLKSFLHFKYFSIFLWLSEALSVFCASFQTSSVKCHFKRLVARRKCKVPCDNWNEFVQIETRRTLTAESSSSATELSLRNLSCELCFAFLFEFSFVPSLYPLKTWSFSSLCEPLWLILNSLVFDTPFDYEFLVFDTQRWNSSKI